MVYVFDILDNDVYDLLSKYINKRVNEIKLWRKNNNIVLNELKNNILFTTHMNYFKKISVSKYINRGENFHFIYMLKNKINTINEIKINRNKIGWIYNTNFPGFSWTLANIKSSELIIIRRKHILYGNYEGILKFPDGSQWELYNYPPHENHYNSKDLIKYLKN